MAITLESLIEEGKNLKTGDNGLGMESVTDENYPMWRNKSQLFLETNYSQISLTEKFVELNRTEQGYGLSNYKEMLGILEAMEEIL